MSCTRVALEKQNEFYSTVPCSLRQCREYLLNKPGQKTRVAHLCRIPVELLGAVKGISLGERRTVKLAIPFSTSQLLEINARQAYDASEEQQTDVGERRMTEGCSEEGRSLVPLYLQSLAGTEKDKFLRKFFSQEGESPGDVGGTAASEVASAADTGDASTEERSNIAGKEQVGISGDTYEDSGEEAEDEIHHIDCLLQVKCVGVKRRIWPAADGR